jgi:predicted transcriptional regulator
VYGMKLQEQIQNLIENRNEPFTAKQIANEIGCSRGVVDKYFQDIRASGIIVPVKLDRYTRVYVQSKKQENISIFTSNYNKIKNYIENTSQPFTSLKIASELSLTQPLVNKHLHKLYLEGYIKLERVYGQKNIYVSNKDQRSISTFITNYDKIMNYIDNSSEPFTAKQIVRELGLTETIVRKTIQKLLAEGHIKLVGVDGYANVYISSKYQGAISSIKTSYDLLKDYVCNLHEPFTVRMLSSGIGFTLSLVKHNLIKLLEEGLVKQVGMSKFPKVYISTIHQDNSPPILTTSTE